MSDEYTLPAWASHRETFRGVVRIDVDCSVAYPAVLEEISRHYQVRGIPHECLDTITDEETGEDIRRVKPDWEQCFRRLFDGDLDQYWLEVAFQFIKMDVQRAVNWPIQPLEIRMHDREKYFAQKNFSEGRGAKQAASMTGGKEAREHWKRIRGTVPGA